MQATHQQTPLQILQPNPVDHGLELAEQRLVVADGAENISERQLRVFQKPSFQANDLFAVVFENVLHAIAKCLQVEPTLGAQFTWLRGVRMQDLIGERGDAVIVHANLHDQLQKTLFAWVKELGQLK